MWGREEWTKCELNPCLSNSNSGVSQGCTSQSSVYIYSIEHIIAFEGGVGYRIKELENAKVGEISG